MVTTAFAVEGLTCGSCLAEVLEQVRTVAGVSGAGVDLVVGGWSPVVVTSGEAVSAQEIRAAVERSGFVVTVDTRATGPRAHGFGTSPVLQPTRMDDDESRTGGVRP